MGVKFSWDYFGALLSLIVLEIWKIFQKMFEHPIESLIQFSRLLISIYR